MSNNNQIKLYDTGSILRGVQDEITSSLREGLLMEDIAVKHTYTLLKAQHIYTGEYIPGDINTNYQNPVTPKDTQEETSSVMDSVLDTLDSVFNNEIGIKVITGTLGFAVGGPIGSTIALAAQGMSQENAEMDQLKEEIANVGNNIADKDEMIVKLYKQVVALRAELNSNNQ